MFRLRQRTRRQLCRVGFLVGCLLPTVALALWGAYRHLPIHRRHQELALRQSLGMRAQIASVEHPRPGIVRYHDLELSTRAAGRPLATCRWAELRRSRVDGSLKLVVHGLQLQPAGLDTWYAFVERALRHDSDEPGPNLRFVIDDITLPESREAESLARISGAIADGEATLSVEPAGATEAVPVTLASSAEPIHLKIVSDTGETSLGQWELHTGTSVIPCSWLAAVVGDFPAARGSRFQGSAWARDTAAGRQLALRGTLRDVDLAGLVTRNFGHFAEGKVDIKLDPAHVQAGRLVELHANVTGGPGRVDRGLVVALASSLGCGLANDQRVAREVISYGQLAVDVAVNPQGQLVVIGRCPGRPDIVLADANGHPLMSQPQTQAQPALNLVRGLGGAGAPDVPLTAQTAQLIGWLPSAATGLPPQATAARSAPKNPAKSRVQ